ncbi:MAG TPA: ABC transporter C-terminal domain-containing protein [Myxococcota bacterium]
MALALCALLGLLAACASPAERSGYGRALYAWSDAAGNVRYTTYPRRIPVVRRATLQSVTPGRSAAENAALFPGARAARDARLETGAGSPAESAARRANLERRIAELEIQIARDEEALKVLISDPAAAPELRNSEELAEIAARLPERQAELRALRAQRDRAADGHGP